VRGCRAVAGRTVSMACQSLRCFLLSAVIEALKRVSFLTAAWQDKPDTKLGVVGLGGLGHMAVQFGRAFGCEVSGLHQNTYPTPSS
jgi:D-arabinose 1-dehydrogenase-like Zn-dependent alcohol dehydrogenase